MDIEQIYRIAQKSSSELYNERKDKKAINKYNEGCIINYGSLVEKYDTKNVNYFLHEGAKILYKLKDIKFDERCYEIYLNYNYFFELVREGIIEINNYIYYPGINKKDDLCPITSYNYNEVPIKPYQGFYDAIVVSYEIPKENDMEYLCGFRDKKKKQKYKYKYTCIKDETIKEFIFNHNIRFLTKKERLLLDKDRQDAHDAYWKSALVTKAEWAYNEDTYKKLSKYYKLNNRGV